MNLNKISEIQPSYNEFVFIFDEDITDIKQSWIVELGKNKCWAMTSGVMAVGGTFGYTFAQYPYWISKEDFLEEIRRNKK